MVIDFTGAKSWLWLWKMCLIRGLTRFLYGSPGCPWCIWASKMAWWLTECPHQAPQVAPWDPLWYVLARRSSRCLPPAARLVALVLCASRRRALGPFLKVRRVLGWHRETKEERLYVTEWSRILDQGPNCVSIYILPSQWNEPWQKQSLLCLTRGAVSNIWGDREERQRPASAILSRAVRGGRSSACSLFLRGILPCLSVRDFMTLSLDSCAGMWPLFQARILTTSCTYYASKAWPKVSAPMPWGLFVDVFWLLRL